MQQRASPTIPTMMDSERSEESPPPSTRGRVNSKLKVLVRCHAMREEASPPREPSPITTALSTSPSSATSPAIKVIPSVEEVYEVTESTQSVQLLSPCPSRGSTSPILSRSASPTSTLVAPTPQSSPRHHNHRHESPEHERHEGSENDKFDAEVELTSSPKYNLNRLNSKNLDKDINSIITNKKDSSQTTNNNNNINSSNNNSRRRIFCDCGTTQNCKCSNGGKSSQERNINNNLANNINNNNNVTGSSNTLTVRTSSKGKLRQQSSSQGSFEGSSSNSPCLSRDGSCEQQYTDTSGINLDLFIPDTLNRNAKDRAFMLRIEQELVNLAKDKVKTHYKFPPMSSYQRMLVHRCAAYFGMEHNIEASGKCVVVNKTKGTRIPDVEFKVHIKEDVVFSEEPRRSILKRDSNSIEDYNFKSPDRQFILENRRSKSFEEREEEYEKARRRIFSRELFLYRQMRDGCPNDIVGWDELQPWSSTDSENSSRLRLQPPEHNRRHLGKLTKVLSEETGETMRPYVAKSYSFGGYGGVLNRGDSVASSHSAGPRLLTKQDSAASSVSWRLSPSSSGYKSVSQMSESVTPSPTSTPHPICDAARHDSEPHDRSPHDNVVDSVVWAVSDIQSVPKGSLIINPQTGEPMTNDDGTLYHYDPSNPPQIFMKPPPSPKKAAAMAVAPPPQTPPAQIKDRSQSPMKKRSNKYSPSRKSHVTNSSTSPSLPYSSPSPQVNPNNRSFQFIGGDALPQFPVYGPGFTPQNLHEGMSVYQQPCIVYTTPYGVPVSPHYDGRMEQPIATTDMGSTYFMGIPESTTPAAQSLTYQQPPYWNQPPVTYFQTPQANPTPPQRFSVPIHPTTQGQTGAYLPPSFPGNYPPPPGSQAPAPPQAQSAADLVPVFPHHHQQVQVVYQQQQPNHLHHHHQSNPVMYSNNLVYAQNSAAVYPTNPIYPAQYPQNTSTPNSCTSSVSHSTFTGQMQDQNVIQLTQNMAQMSFMGPPQPQTQQPLHQQHQQQMHHHHQQQQQAQQNYRMMGAPPLPHCYDMLRQKTCTPNKAGKYVNPINKGAFLLSSSQSSTGTSSPAATVVAAAPGYQQPPPPPLQAQQMYRASPAETPPSQFAYNPNFHHPMPPMLYRQMSNNNRVHTPGTSRSSRSPTPASDNSNPHFVVDNNKQRMPPPLPSTLYHGMPYVLQPPDSRLVNRGGQPQPQFHHRHPPPPSMKQPHFGHPNQDNRSHHNNKNNNRRSRGGKASGAPPTNKPV